MLCYTYMLYMYVIYIYLYIYVMNNKMLFSVDEYSTYHRRMEHINIKKSFVRLLKMTRLNSNQSRKKYKLYQRSSHTYNMNKPGNSI